MSLEKKRLFPLSYSHPFGFVDIIETAKKRIWYPECVYGDEIPNSVYLKVSLSMCSIGNESNDIHLKYAFRVEKKNRIFRIFNACFFLLIVNVCVCVCSCLIEKVANENKQELKTTT